MTVIGKLDVDKYGQIQMRRVIVEDLTAPGSNISVDAGSTTVIQVNVASEVPHNILYAGVESITGLPSDIKIQSISFDKNNKLLSLTLYNAGGSAVDINANSLTIRVISIA